MCYSFFSVYSLTMLSQVYILQFLFGLENGFFLQFALWSHIVSLVTAWLYKCKYYHGFSSSADILVCGHVENPSQIYSCSLLFKLVYDHALIGCITVFLSVRSTVFFSSVPLILITQNLGSGCTGGCMSNGFKGHTLTCYIIMLPIFLISDSPRGRLQLMVA